VSLAYKKVLQPLRVVAIEGPLLGLDLAMRGEGVVGKLEREICKASNRCVFPPRDLVYLVG
jgi:hypothetical protein